MSGAAFELGLSSFRHSMSILRRLIDYLLDKSSKLIDAF